MAIGLELTHIAVLVQRHPRYRYSFGLGSTDLSHHFPHFVSKRLEPNGDIDRTRLAQDGWETPARLAFDTNGTASSCPRLVSERDGAETRTLILWGATGVVALATAVTGLFIVHWKNGRAAIGGAPGGGIAGVGVGAEQRF